MLENLRIKTRQYPCVVGEFDASLSEADKEILMDNLVNPEVTHLGLSKALKDVGVKISDSSIWRHRTGLCSCSRI